MISPIAPLNVRFAARKQQKPKILFISDFNGTYDDHSNAIARSKLDVGLGRIKEEAGNQDIDFRWAMMTARPPGRLMEKNPPDHMDYCGVFNGGQLYRGLPTDKRRIIKSWQELNQKDGFDAPKVLELAEQIANTDEFENMVVKSVGEVVSNPEADACPTIATICITHESIQLEDGETQALFQPGTFEVPQQVQRFVAKLQSKVEETGLRPRDYRVTGPYLFKGKPYIMFDVAAPKANKEDATDFLMEYVGVEPDHTIIAGDGGNDIGMMKKAKRLIVAGADVKLRQAVANLVNDETTNAASYLGPPREASSTSVLDGLDFHVNNIIRKMSEAIKMVERSRTDSSEAILPFRKEA